MTTTAIKVMMITKVIIKNNDGIDNQNNNNGDFNGNDKDDDNTKITT